jgi:hypothetical protein
MAERIAICSAKRDNRILGYIEGSEAFDLSGRRRADYNPNTGLLYGLLDGGVVGYLTFDSKFAGLSTLADEMFPKTHKVTPHQSPEDYVNNLSIVGVQETGEQRRAECIALVGAVSETKSAPLVKTIEPAVDVSPGYPRHERTQQEPISSSSGWIGTGELVGHDGAEDVVSVTGVYEMPRLASAAQDEAPPTNFSNVERASHVESYQPEPPSVPSGSVTNEVFSRRDAEHDFPIDDNSDTRISAPPLQHEDTRSSERCPNGPELRVAGAGQGIPENEPVSSIKQTPNSPLAGRDDAAARTPLPNGENGPDESAESKRTSSDSHVLGVVQTFMQRVAEYVDSTHNDIKESPSPSPSRQDEVANLFSNYDISDTHREVLRGDGFPCAPGEGFVEDEAHEDTFTSTNGGQTSSERDEEAETNFSSGSDDHNLGQEARGTGFEDDSCDQANGINEKPSPSLSKKGKQAGADLDSNYDDNAPQQHDPADPCALGGVDSEEKLNSVKEASSASVSKRDEEAGGKPDTKSDDHIFSKGHSHSDRDAERLGPFGAANSFGDAVSSDELNNISDTPDEFLSGQDEAEATPHSEPTDASLHENYESKLDANNTGVVVSRYFGQRNAQDGDSVHGIEEKPSPPLIEQNKAERSSLSDLDDDTGQENAASGQYLESSTSAPRGRDLPKHLPVEQSASDLPKSLFEVDLKRAVGMVRSDLAKSGYGANPTADSDLERAVDIFRKELETEAYRTNPGRS